MTVKYFTCNAFQENSYLLHDEQGHGMIIDPGFSSAAERAELERYLADRGVEPVALVNTHCHIDHVLGLPWVVERFGLPFWAHAGDEPMLVRTAQVAAAYGLDFEGDVPPIARHLREGDTLELGLERLEVLHVPGHSPGSVVLLNRARKWLVGGDVLFQGSIGRTDLPGGNHQQLLDGIRSKLLCLPDDFVVYAGHGEPTTIGRERRLNPFLRF